jgi:hypothetical protein
MGDRIVAIKASGQVALGHHAEGHERDIACFRRGVVYLKKRHLNVSALLENYSPLLAHLIQGSPAN